MTKTGKLSFHSETGTEGGYYALQDSENIAYAVPKWGVFTHEDVYEPEDEFKRGKVRSAYNRDGSKFQCARPGDVSYLDISWEDDTEDIARPSNTVHVEQWGYEGLVILKSADILTIFEKGVGSTALWGGLVQLERQDPYAEGSYAPFGMASHLKPLGVDPVTPDEWTSWFFQGQWASLERPE